MLLPYPLSANKYWRMYQGRMLLSREAKAYKAESGWIAKTCGIKLTDKPVRIHVKLHPKTKKNGEASESRIDLDNALKVAIDSLNGIAYQDDKQVVHIVAELASPLTDGGLTVYVEEFV